WKSETRVPRTPGGATSAMYMGPPTEVRPMPQPTRKRPAMSVGTLLARALRSDARAKVRPAAPAAPVGKNAREHGCDGGARGDGADVGALGRVVNQKFLLNVGARPRDDACIIAEETPADRRDDRYHHNREAQLRLRNGNIGRRRALDAFRHAHD